MVLLVSLCRQPSESQTDKQRIVAELVGGDREVDKDLFTTSGDSLIINVGSAETAGQHIHPRDTGNW